MSITCVFRSKLGQSMMVVDRPVKVFGPPSLSPASRGPRRRGLRSQGDRQLGLLLALQLRHGRVDGTVPGPLHAQPSGRALDRVGKRSGPHPAPIHKHSRAGGHGRHRKPGLRRHRPVPVLSSQPLRAAESFTEPSSLLQTEPPQLAIHRSLYQLLTLTLHLKPLASSRIRSRTRSRHRCKRERAIRVSCRRSARHL